MPSTSPARQSSRRRREYLPKGVGRPQSARPSQSMTKPDIALSLRLIRRPGQGTGLGELAAQLNPGIAGIMAGEQLAIMAAGEDSVRVGGMRRKRPNRRIWLDRQGQPLHTPPAVFGSLDGPGAADRAVSGGDEQNLGVVRFQRQAAAIRQAEVLADTQPLPAFAAIGARKNLPRSAGQH